MEQTETMKQNQEALADLIEINNDRIAGYNKAEDFLEEDKDDDLRNLFKDMAAQSRQFVKELQIYLDEPEEGTTARGKIYRAWMGVKATFTTNDRKAALESCEFGEDAALRAYSTALQDHELSADVRSVLEKQMRTLTDAHDKIRSLRDSERR